MSGLATCCPIRTRNSGPPAPTSHSARPSTIFSGVALCLAGPMSQSMMARDSANWAISHNAFNITKISYAGNGAVMS